MSGQVFASVPEVASLYGRDQRTVRRACEKGTIPAKRIGNRWAIPTSWLAEQAGLSGAPPDAGGSAAPDADELAMAVADEVLRRLAKVLAAASGSAGPA
jgi:Helix-turn-helix domain